MAVWQWGECRVNSDSLMHYGISGQKHGVRRFQNDDGTLTSEGKERYANKKDYSGKDDGIVRTLAKSSFLGRNTVGDIIARGKGERAEAQRKANAAKKEYTDHTSTKKLVAQDLLLGKFGAQNYRAARARGAGRLRSLLETTAGVGLVGTTLAAKGNKKKYGKHIVLSAINDEEYTADGMVD